MTYRATRPTDRPRRRGTKVINCSNVTLPRSRCVTPSLGGARVLAASALVATPLSGRRLRHQKPIRNSALASHDLKAHRAVGQRLMLELQRFARLHGTWKLRDRDPP